MALIFFILGVILFGIRVSCRSVLLLGDSIDRNIVEEWCEFYGYVEDSTPIRRTNMTNMIAVKTLWAEDAIKYFRHRGVHYLQLPCEHCDNTRGNSISSLHLYGSRATGPYFKGIDSQRDPYVDSKARIKKGLEIYHTSFGSFSRVFLHTVQWDAQAIRESHGSDLRSNAIAWNETISRFRTDLNDRIDEIFSHMPSTGLEVGLRTAVWEHQGGAVIESFNNIIRDIAASRQLTLFDYDRDVWSTVNFDRSQEHTLFRDWLHPKKLFSAGAGEKMLGNRYSKHFLVKGEPIQSFTQPYQFLNFTVKLLQDIADRNASVSLYFIEVRDNEVRKWSGVPSNLIQYFDLGDADVMPVSRDLLKRIKTAGSMPPFFEDGLTLISTASGRCFLIDPEIKRPRAVAEATISLLRTIGKLQLLSNVSDFWIDHMRIEESIPSIQDGSLIRLSSDRSIYAICNQTKMLVPSMDVFVAHGFDTSNVTVLSASRDRWIFDAIPRGNELV